MGFTRLAYAPLFDESLETIGALTVFAAAIAASILWGAAIGGLFGKTMDGAVWGFLTFPLFVALMPAVMH